MFNWISAFRRLSDDDALNQQSLDSYLFLRFFKMIILICLVGTCITWVTLLPINYMGDGGKSQLSKLTLSNVDDVQKFYWHAGVAWVFLGIKTLAFAQSSDRLIVARLHHVPHHS